MAEDPSLSYYIRFYRLIQEMYDEGEITAKEKNKLKVNLAIKEPELMAMMPNIEQISNQEIIAYIQQRPTVVRQLSPSPRRQSLMQESSPLGKGYRRSSLFKDQKYTEDDIIGLIDSLQDAIYTCSNDISVKVNEKLKQLQELILKVPAPKEAFSIALLQETNILDEAKQTYKDLKLQFTQYQKSHLLLLEDSSDVFGVLKNLIKGLVQCDDFTFVSSLHGTYSLRENVFSNEKLQDLEKIIGIVELNESHAFLQSKFHFETTFGLQLDQDEYCFFHQEKRRSSLLGLANEYGFQREVLELGQFLVKTIKESRVQSFSPSQVEHMIHDLGISFVRCSKYQLINNIQSMLKLKYSVEKKMGSSNVLTPSDSPLVKPRITRSTVLFEFKDIVPIYLRVTLDLNKKEDLEVYKSINIIYSKYIKFIEQNYDRMTYQKFFMKSRDSLIFEFDKNGQLIFLSRPIPKGIKNEYGIEFSSNCTYKTLFKHQKLQNDIESHLQAKWELSEDRNMYEIYMKMEEKKFKGFVIIFQEQWIKDKSLDGEVKQLKLQQETLEYIAKLEQNNPGIEDTIISMFKPVTTTISQIQIKNVAELRRKCIFNGVINIPIPVAINNIDPNDLVIPPSYYIDDLTFNILSISDKSVEKQRVVYEVFKRNNFIEKHQIDTELLAEFLSELEYKYNKNSNPFHNYDHGVNVMQSCHYISNLLEETQYKGVLDDLTKFALIVSGLCHDVAHTGRTNIFEMNSLSQLAVRYHDKSVLEQHHAATAIKMMLKEEMNFVANIDFRAFRKLFISNILYTDIAEHFNLLKNFEVITTVGESEVKLLTGMIIHASDFAGTANHYQISHAWSHKVNQEFSAQFKEEGRMGYPQQPFMKDLHKLSVVSKAEMGFIKFIVRPLYLSISKFLENKLQHRVDNLDQTIIQWDILYQQAIEDENKLQQS